MDVQLVERDFPNLTGAGWGTVDGAAEAAQNIVEALFVPTGRLPWDRAAGSVWTSFLNARIRPPAVLDELRRVAVKTPKVWPQSVVATYDARRGDFGLAFTGPDGSSEAMSITP